MRKIPAGWPRISTSRVRQAASRGHEPNRRGEAGQRTRPVGRATVWFHSIVPRIILAEFSGVVLLEIACRARDTGGAESVRRGAVGITGCEHQVSTASQP